jgi:hypothetical protein
MRARTAEAMLLLCWARALVALVPLRLWRDSLGARAGDAPDTTAERLDEARLLARHVERGAGRLLFETKCLPRAMALSWMLRRRHIPHVVKIAVRPAGLRDGDDGRHAWVETAGVAILGELPGPWLIMLSLGDGPTEGCAERGIR